MRTYTHKNSRNKYNLNLFIIYFHMKSYSLQKEYDSYNLPEAIMSYLCPNLGPRLLIVSRPYHLV